MKKIMIAAAVVGLGLGLAKASTNNLIGRTIPGANPLQAAKAETKGTTTVCYELCDLNGNCYTECTTTQN
jgi:hypothetical protein